MADDKTIGRVSVRVDPNLKWFREDAKRKLEAEEKRLPKLEATVNVRIADGAISQVTAQARAVRNAAQAAMKDLQLSVNLDDRGSIQRAIAQIDAELSNLRRVQIPVGLNEADLSAMRELLDERLQDTQIRVKVDLEDPNSIRRAVAEIDRELNKVRAVEIRVDPDRSSLEQFREELVERLASFKAKVEPEVSTPAAAVAETRLNFLARARDAVIRPVISRAGTSALSVVSVLSGWQALTRSISQARELLFGMFTRMPELMAAVPAVLALAGGFFSMTANLTGLVGSLTQALPMLLALPGIAIGIGTMVTALADFGDQLPGVVSQLKELQPIISAAFWEQARAPIEALANTVLPQLRSGFEGVASEIGAFAGTFSEALSGALSGGVLEGWFANLQASVTAFTPAIEHLVSIFTQFGNVGSALLPPLAEYTAELAARFDAFFARLVDGAGGLEGFVGQTMAAFQGIVEFIISIGNVFGAVFQSAADAGAATFASIAEHLNNFAEWLRSPDIAQGMTDLFGSAFEMFENFFSTAGPALQDFLSSIGSVLTAVLPQVGSVLGEVAAGFAAIFNNEAALAGVQAFIQGILTGVQAILPALEPIGALIAALGPTLGTLATQIGNVFGALAPSFSGVLSALSPIIEMLGSGLAQALTAVSPLLTTLGTALASLFGQIQPLIQPVISALVSLISTVVPPLMDFVMALVPPLTAIVSVIAPVIANLLGALAPMLVSIVEAATPILTLIADLVNMLAPVLIPVLTILAEVLGTAIQWAVEGAIKVIRGLLEVITGIIDFIVGVFTGDWSRAWDGIKAIFQGVIDVIVGIVQFIFGVSDAGSIYGLVKTGLTKLKTFWDDIWNAVKSFIQQTTDNIIATIRGWIDGIVGFFSGLWGRISGFVSDVWNNIKTRFVEGSGQMFDIVVNGINDVVTWFKELPGRIVDALGSLGSLLLTQGRQIIDGLVDGIKNSAHRVVETMKSYVLDQIPDFVKDFFGIASPSKMFREFGENLMQGLADGIREESSSALAAIKAVANDVEGVDFRIGNVRGLSPNAAMYQPVPGSTGNTLIYHAAPGSSIDSREDLFDAMGRARAFGW